MTALHQELAQTLLARIETGRLAVGDKLRPEAEYAADLGVSRATLRVAYTELEHVGVMLRRKRTGATIIADRPKAQFSMSTPGLHELLSLGRDTDLVRSGKRTVTAADITQLQDDTGEASHGLEISGTRKLLGDTVPFNSTRIYVPARFAGIADNLGDTEPSVFRKLEGHFDLVVGRVNQTAQAIRCPDAIADMIGLDPGAPALRIVAQLCDRSAVLMKIRWPLSILTASSSRQMSRLAERGDGSARGVGF